VVELSSDVISGGGLCLFCGVRPFRTEKNGQLSWNIRTQKYLVEWAAPVHSGAFERSRIVDSTSQDFPWGSGKWHPGDVACPSEKSTIVISAQLHSVLRRLRRLADEICLRIE
jgi:hypothetical protein